MNVIDQITAEVARATEKFPTWPTDPLNALRLNVELGAKVIKDGGWFWPEMKCGCGAVGCYDLTTDIGCRSCLIARGKIVVVTIQDGIPLTVTAPNAEVTGAPTTGTNKGEEV